MRFSYFLTFLILFLPTAGFAQEGYYQLGKETVALHVVREGNEAGNWKTVTKPDGKTLEVSTQAGISSMDIEGIGISPNPYTHDLEARILFKAASWPKVHDIT